MLEVHSLITEQARQKVSRQLDFGNLDEFITWRVNGPCLHDSDGSIRRTAQTNLLQSLDPLEAICLGVIVTFEGTAELESKGDDRGVDGGSVLEGVADVADSGGEGPLGSRIQFDLDSIDEVLIVHVAIVIGLDKVVQST